ncbi:MAG TPA: hypothetical protein VGO45_10530 [Bacteroidia bacterium]|jgi:hypothetical protein|nr:hypothetical protein [Bacteroidia bacterium]
MKTQKNTQRNLLSGKALLAILLISMNIFPAFGHDGQALIKRGGAAEKNDCLELFSNITFGGHAMTGLTVRLYRGENLIAEIPGTERTYITLEKNNQYTVSYSAKGYVTRTISIDTHLPENAAFNSAFRFEFNLEMMREGKAEASYDLDFPVALVCYNKASDRFEYSKTYTGKIRGGIVESAIQASPVYSEK